MNGHSVINAIANIVAILGWLPVALFVGFYGARSQWRSTLVGRSLMYQSAAFLVVLTIVMIGIWWPDMPGRAMIRLIGYTIMVITMWRMFFTLLHYQRQWSNAEKLVRKLNETAD